MYGTTKIEAIPLSNQTDGQDPAPAPSGTEPPLPQDSEPSSGRLFLPPSLKRSEKHPNPAVSLNKIVIKLLVHLNMHFFKYTQAVKGNMFPTSYLTLIQFLHCSSDAPSV